MNASWPMSFMKTTSSSVRHPARIFTWPDIINSGPCAIMSQKTIWSRFLILLIFCSWRRITITKMQLTACNWLWKLLNPFSPAKAPNLAELRNPITRQEIELESYPNHPQIQQAL